MNFATWLEIGTMANRPEVLRTFVPFYGAVVGKGSIDRRIKELVYLTVSYANECAYCTASHLATGKKAGITEEEVRALQTQQEHSFLVCGAHAACRGRCPLKQSESGGFESDSGVEFGADCTLSSGRDCFKNSRDVLRSRFSADAASTVAASGSGFSTTSSVREASGGPSTLSAINNSENAAVCDATLIATAIVNEC